jgi:glycosyltransferase involved in cell wall biosynthesis
VPWYDAFGAADDRSIPATLLRPPSTDAVPTTADALGLPARMDGDGPLVSVVVPTHDDDHCLPAALQTVGAQTHRTLELLLVDADDTPWLAALADDRPWVRHLVQPSTGLSAARNDGIAAADGEYVALLDADDYWHPDKLRRQLDALDDGAVTYCAHYRAYLREGDDPLVTCRDLAAGPPATAYRQRFRGEIHVSPSTLLWRRRALPARPFDESLDASEDFAFLVDAFREHPPVHLPDPLCVKRVRHGAMTDDARWMYDARGEALDALVDRHPDLGAHLDHCQARRERRLGVSLLRAGEAGDARRHLARSLRRDPTNHETVALYAAALVPVDGRRAFRALQYVRNNVLAVLTPGGPGRREVTVYDPADAGEA